MNWNLEPVDMIIHAAIAFVCVLLVGIVLIVFGWSIFLLTPWSFIVQGVFYVREALQQGKKNNPPANKWNPAQWGPRGIAEWVCVIPAVIIAQVIISLFA